MPILPLDPARSLTSLAGSALALCLGVAAPAAHAQAVVCWDVEVQDLSGATHKFALNMSAVSMTPGLFPAPYGSFTLTGAAIWPNGELHSAHASAMVGAPSAIPGMPGAPSTKEAVWMTIVLTERPESDEPSRDMSAYIGNAILDLWEDAEKETFSMSGRVTFQQTTYDAPTGFSNDNLVGTMKLDFPACTPTT